MIDIISDCILMIAKLLAAQCAVIAAQVVDARSAKFKCSVTNQLLQLRRVHARRAFHLPFASVIYQKQTSNA